MSLRNRVRLDFLSRPENVGLARVVAASFASEVDFDLSEIEEIRVAVSEAVTNAIVHGYEQMPGGVITLTLSLYDDLLEIIVEDAGKGIADLNAALRAGVGSDPEHLGLGFTFMKTFMDDVDVWTEVGRGTRVKLTKVLPGDRSLKGCVEN